MNSGRAAADFERRFARKAQAGRPPDALRRYSPDESERFWARTVPGPDGHVYWTGGESFTMNSGRSRAPHRWVWMREHGSIPQTTDVWRTCGEPNCVALDHLTAGRIPARDRFSRQQMLGYLQVVVLREGRVPTSAREYTRLGGRPSHNVIAKYFGTWERFVQAAGFEPPPRVASGRGRVPFSDSELFAALRALAKRLGRTPTYTDYEKDRAWLQQQGHPRDAKTFRRLGGFPAARRKAGLDDDD